jgi:hypothetical protein
MNEANVRVILRLFAIGLIVWGVLDLWAVVPWLLSSSTIEFGGQLMPAPERSQLGKAALCFALLHGVCGSALWALSSRLARAIVR